MKRPKLNTITESKSDVKYIKSQQIDSRIDYAIKFLHSCQRIKALKFGSFIQSPFRPELAKKLVKSLKYIKYIQYPIKFKMHSDLINSRKLLASCQNLRGLNISLQCAMSEKLFSFLFIGIHRLKKLSKISYTAPPIKHSNMKSILNNLGIQISKVKKLNCLDLTLTNQNKIFDNNLTGLLTNLQCIESLQILTLVLLKFEDLTIDDITLLEQIISKQQNLQSLKLEFQGNQEVIKEDSYKHIAKCIQSIPKNLVELELHFYDCSNLSEKKFLNIIQYLPKLQKLYALGIFLDYFEGGNSNNILTSLLESLSKFNGQLKKLQIHIEGTSFGTNQSLELFQTVCSKNTNLQNIAFGISLEIESSNKLMIQLISGLYHLEQLRILKAQFQGQNYSNSSIEQFNNYLCSSQAKSLEEIYLVLETKSDVDRKLTLDFFNSFKNLQKLRKLQLFHQTSQNIDDYFALILHDLVINHFDAIRYLLFQTNYKPKNLTRKGQSLLLNLESSTRMRKIIIQLFED